MGKEFDQWDIKQNIINQLLGHENIEVRYMVLKFINSNKKRFLNFSNHLNEIDQKESTTRHYKELMRFFVSDFFVKGNLNHNQQIKYF